MSFLEPTTLSVTTQSAGGVSGRVWSLGKAWGAVGSDSNSASNPQCALGQVTTLRDSSVNGGGCWEAQTQSPSDLLQFKQPASHGL